MKNLFLMMQRYVDYTFWRKIINKPFDLFSKIVTKTFDIRLFNVILLILTYNM